MHNIASTDPNFNVEDFERRERALRQGRCPNDGAILTILCLSERECPVCGFSHVVFGGTFEVDGDVQ